MSLALMEVLFRHRVFMMLIKKGLLSTERVNLDFGAWQRDNPAKKAISRDNQRDCDRFAFRGGER